MSKFYTVVRWVMWFCGILILICQIIIAVAKEILKTESQFAYVA